MKLAVRLLLVSAMVAAVLVGAGCDSKTKTTAPVGDGTPPPDPSGAVKDPKGKPPVPQK